MTNTKEFYACGIALHCRFHTNHQSLDQVKKRAIEEKFQGIKMVERGRATAEVGALFSMTITGA